MSAPVRVVAFGGGHGLSASLRALRVCAAKLDVAITAVVTVGDDGGSSGRLRVERGGLPPGDLRKALAALAADDPDSARTVDLFEHRYASRPGTGGGPLTGHAVGNLVLCGLMELLGDPVAALDHVAGLVRACGRVLPMSHEPVGIEADIVGLDAREPERIDTVRGQHAVAATSGRVVALRLSPPAPPACPEAVAAVRDADVLIFGPGSWYTSVLPHLLVPDLAAAITASRAARLVTLNLAPDAETAGLSLAGHLAALRHYLPALRVDAVLADTRAVGEQAPVAAAAQTLGARLVTAPVAVADGDPRHDPAALGAALVPLLAPAR